MRKMTWGVVAVGGLAGALWLAEREPAPAPLVAPTELRPPPVAAPPARPGRPAREPDPVLLESARRWLAGGGREERCGPYRLYTDVADADLVTACGRLAAELDDLYRVRFGVEPRGAPAEAIVIFAELESFRELARDQDLPLGNAGWAMASRGLAVFYAGDRPLEVFVATLAHELTHLVSRRALGPDLPPWLSEGLADAIGDSAGAQGFGPLEDEPGDGVQTGRLRRAYADGRAGSLARLAALERGEFDREIASFDYEQSALLVRFLLADPELARGFRVFLRRLADGEPYAPALLTSSLDLDWDSLDRRFAAWLVG